MSASSASALVTTWRRNPNMPPAHTTTTTLPPQRPFVEFSAPDVEEGTRVSGTATDMWWIGLSRTGLTYEGTCGNKACLAWHEGPTAWPGRTACKQALGSYRPNEDFDYSRVKCPACSHHFLPERFVFMNCTVAFQYRLPGQQPRNMNFTVIGDKSIHVLGTPGRQVVYTSLVFDVRAADSDENDSGKRTGAAAAAAEGLDDSYSMQEGETASAPQLLSF
eukprot:TRINITY_DN7206_c0_g3_i1.p1 TRINITY_DN7206_c0_g3~~TRINITY_DN7206_c0_g3_i1.p1  ORF type:complete len:220 (-),score=26.77 TRINITY_DN7206_c0_g3_i1:197-856(-)